MAVPKEKQRVINGINTNLLADTIRSIRNRPQIAKFKFRANNKWVTGAHCTTTIKDFYGVEKEDTSRTRPFVLEADEPAVLLGEDHGPNATEAALYALASCLNATFVYYAATKGVKLDELEFTLEGDMDIQGFLGISDQIRRGFQNITVTCRVRGDATREKLEELCQLARQHSPVFNIVTNKVPVTVRTEVL
ncbi:MAG: OsmC family protein [Deltaproteobacteria bacterium]|nr:OsmC family protein [Deltaproteobacteria bacterium]